MSLFLEEQETEKRSTTDTSNADNSEKDKRFVSSTVPGFVLLCLFHYLALHLENVHCRCSASIHLGKTSGVARGYLELT